MSTEEQLQQRNKELERENEILRGIAAKLMPCHYCGVDSIGKCPSGFPGCALADDIMAADDCANRKCRELQSERDHLRAELDALKLKNESLISDIIEHRTLLDRIGFYCAGEGKFGRVSHIITEHLAKPNPGKPLLDRLTHATDLLRRCWGSMNEIVAHGNCDCNLPDSYTCLVCECEKSRDAINEFLKGDTKE